MCARRLVRRDPTSFSFNSVYEIARLVMTKGLRAYCPKYVLTVFMYAGFRSNMYVLSVHVDLWIKVTYLYLVYNLCALHYCECNQLVIILNTKFSQYLYSVQVQVVFINIDIPSIQVQLFFSAYYLLRFVAHLVLFTILGFSGGVSEVGPSNSS